MKLRGMLCGAPFFALLLPIAGFADELPIIGLDKNHQETVRSLSKEDYVQQFQATIMAVHESTLSTLQSQPKSTRWMLRDVIIGIGFSLNSDLGPIWKVTAESTVRLCYSNSTHPKIPD